MAARMDSSCLWQRQHLRTQRRQHRQLERPPQLQRAAILAKLQMLLRRRRTEQTPISAASAAAWWTRWTCRTARSASRHPDRSTQPAAQAIPSLAWLRVSFEKGQIFFRNFAPSPANFAKVARNPCIYSNVWWSSGARGGAKCIRSATYAKLSLRDGVCLHSLG